MHVDILSSDLIRIDLNDKYKDIYIALYPENNTLAIRVINAQLITNKQNSNNVLIQVTD
jgi:3-methyladenine DNA glycosylase AlkD